MSEIKILVSSEAGKGGTAIANQISKCLKVIGYNVNLVDNDLSPEEINHSCIKLISDSDLTINIETQQLPRS